MDKRLFHIYDKTLKFIASNNLIPFFLLFGIFCWPLYPVPNEIIDEKLNKNIMDFPVFTLNGIVNLEFQLKTKDFDILRFIRYSFHLLEKHCHHVYAVVIDFEIDEDKKEVVWLNRRDRFTIYFKSLKARDPDKILNIIRYKLEIRQRLSGVDIVALELLPFMDLSRKVELLEAALDIFYQLDTYLISVKKLIEIRQVLLNYCEAWKETEKIDYLVRYCMKEEELCSEAFESVAMVYKEDFKAEGREEGIEEGFVKGRKEGLEKGREEGLEKGREEERYNVAKDMIRDGFPVEQVSKYSHLEIAIINSLMVGK